MPKHSENLSFSSLLSLLSICTIILFICPFLSWISIIGVHFTVDFTIRAPKNWYATAPACVFFLNGSTKFDMLPLVIIFMMLTHLLLENITPIIQAFTNYITICVHRIYFYEHLGAAFLYFITIWWAFSYNLKQFTAFIWKCVFKF